MHLKKSIKIFTTIILSSSTLYLLFMFDENEFSLHNLLCCLFWHSRSSSFNSTGLFTAIISSIWLIFRFDFVWLILFSTSFDINFPLAKFQNLYCFNFGHLHCHLSLPVASTFSACSIVDYKQLNYSFQFSYVVQSASIRTIIYIHRNLLFSGYL